MKPEILWPLVVLVAIAMAGAITLAALHQDITIIITLVTILVVPALGAFGVKIHENLQEVKTSVNGERTELMNQIRELTAQVRELALRVPTTPEDE